MTEILDFVVIALLSIAIIYGFILNRKITLIHESKKELANLFQSFDDTILKAQKGINDLKMVSSEVSNGLQSKIDKAAILIDDIMFLNEKAAETTKNMEKKVANHNKKTAEENLITNQLTTLAPKQIKELKEETKKPSKDRIQALESLLEKIADSNKTGMQDNEFPKEINNDNQRTHNELNIHSENKKSKMVSEALIALGYGDNK